MTAKLPTNFLICGALVGLGLIYSPATVNPELTFVAIASLALIFWLLWIPGQPPALALIFGMQWLQASAKVFHANILGAELWTLSDARSIDEAVYLSLLWVVILALGARLAVGRVQRLEPVPGSGQPDVDLRTLTLLYLCWSVGTAAIGTFAAGGIARQIFNAIVNVRWAFVFAIFVLALRTKRGRPIMWTVFGVELVAGFLSFFAEFKVPLFLLMLAIVATGYKFSIRQSVGLAAVFAGTVYLGITWSVIKGDYRETLNEGTGAQVIRIDTETQIRELINLVTNVDEESLVDGVELLAIRVAYVDFFAFTLDHVPRVRAHEEGGLWGEAIRHVLAPRVLFPDKAALEHDSKVSEKYTGLSLYYDPGTSISIGLPAITYVDFGARVMFLVALLVGFLHGAAYRYFASRAPGEALAQGFAVAVTIPHTTFESSAAKTLGGLLMTFIVAMTVWHVVIPAALRLLSGARAYGSSAAQPE